MTANPDVRRKRMTEAELVAVVENAAREGSWNAAAWLLERRYRTRWGKKQPVPKPAPEPVRDPLAAVVEIARAS